MSMNEHSRRISPNALTEDWKNYTYYERLADIELLKAQALGNTLANKDVIESFAISLGECRELPDASPDDITVGERNHWFMRNQAGAADVVTAE
jgi:hypothetical protein